jgi:hypothetical protein
MPIEITNAHIDEAQDVLPEIQNADGSLTLVGRVLEAFLESVDMSDLMDDEDAAEYIETSDAFMKQKDDSLVVCEEKDEGAEQYSVEEMAGDVVSAIIDEDDLGAMFEYFAKHLPESTTEERVFKAAAMELIGEGEVIDEVSTFKKGDFRKIRTGAKKTTGGKTGPALVNRMLGAMLRKEAITRAKNGPGRGYKAGDYDKNPAGYGQGTKAGLKSVAMYKAKKAGALKVQARKVKGAAGSEAKLKAKAMADKAKKKAKLAGLKKAPGKMVKASGKKSLTASHDHVSNVMESEQQVHRAASLVAKVTVHKKK